MTSKGSAPGANAGAIPLKEEAWHRREAADVLRECDSSAIGLSTAKAVRRLEANGPNELKEGKRLNAFQIFLRQFKSIIIWIRIVAGVALVAPDQMRRSPATS